MGNLLRHADEVILQMHDLGTQAAANNLAFVICPIDGFLKALVARLRTSGDGNMDVDINKNGTTWIGTTKLRFANGNTLPNAFTYKNLAVSKNDVLSFDVDAVPAAPGADLAIALLISRDPHGDAEATF